MDQVSTKTKNGRPVKTAVSDKLLRYICGWSLIASSLGVFIDESLCDGCTEGSFGLVPLYLGFLIGSATFVPVLHRAVGWLPASIAALGAVGMIATLGLIGSYYATGSEPYGLEFAWIGAFLVGIAHLFLPISGRIASVFWVMIGTLGLPEVYLQPGGIASPFTLLGIATAFSGLFVLFGLPRFWQPYATS